MAVNIGYEWKLPDDSCLWYHAKEPDGIVYLGHSGTLVEILAAVDKNAILGYLNPHDCDYLIANSSIKLAKIWRLGKREKLCKFDTGMGSQGGIKFSRLVPSQVLSKPGLQIVWNETGV